MTKYYLHDATSSVSGTLPSTNQSSLTFTVLADALTVNRSMNGTIGSGPHVAKSLNTAAQATQVLYYTRFISPPLGAQTISANTWDYNFAANENATSGNFPVNGTSQPVYINCYVWRPSTGAKVGTILQGNSASVYNEPSALSVAKVMNGTFSGTSLAIQDGDVLVFEVMFQISQGNTTSRPDIFYYDGTTENTTANTTVTNHASFIQTPQTLSLSTGGSQTTTDNGKTTVHAKPIKVV